MPDTPSITLVKQFQYRGLPEEWSNTYHFLGSTPSSAAEWATLTNAIWAEERKILSSSNKLVKAYGYVAGNENSVFQRGPDDPDISHTTGTQSLSDMAGDQAVWIRWATGTRNSKGRPIYLRKYYHGITRGSGADLFDSTTRTAMLAFGPKMVDGSLPGGFRYCTPQGAVGSTVKVPTFVTVRTLKRRGKDPS